MTGWWFGTWSGINELKVKCFHELNLFMEDIITNKFRNRASHKERK